MEAQASTDSPSIFFQHVANAFVDQYYRLLHSSPEMVHKFYQDKSVLSRPGLNTEMTSVTTMEDIKEKIMSFDYKDHKTEIITVDAQESLMGGVLVAVTGCLIGKDNARRNFIQMFFLAKQQKGYYVLNDVLRFADVYKQSTTLTVQDTEENVPSDPSTKDSEPGLVANHASNPSKVVTDNGVRVADPSSEIKDSVVEEVVVPKSPVNPSPSDVLPAVKLTSNNQKDSQKASYASMVAKESVATSPAHASARVIVRLAPKANQHSPASAVPEASVASSTPKASTASLMPRASSASATPKASAPRGEGAPLSSSAHAEVKGIYVGNLPGDITKNQLIGVFKKFGTIKQDGVQIRIDPEDGFCFGFVEFISANSARSAVEAGNITLGGNEAFIHYKRSSTQFVNNRGKLASERGGFRNDNFRDRENTGESRGSWRYESRDRGDFPGRARNNIGRNEEAHRKVYQNGEGRVIRRGAK